MVVVLRQALCFRARWVRSHAQVVVVCLLPQRLYLKVSQLRLVCNQFLAVLWTIYHVQIKVVAQKMDFQLLHLVCTLFPFLFVRLATYRVTAVVARQMNPYPLRIRSLTQIHRKTPSLCVLLARSHVAAGVAQLTSLW
eukprot:gb/GEZN01022198.1/.p2 GENE.gb/GEZN01022198.1/~~gb/GEZN01022198.1/.p2  ORF type:complete len:138 (+),score=2.89 gb/GEZN01022198.1/:32-445(+)